MQVSVKYWHIFLRLLCHFITDDLQLVESSSVILLKVTAVF